MNNTTQNIIKLFLAGLFLGCLASMPYGYYQLVRTLGMVGFAALAWADSGKSNKALCIIWVASAVLINPLFKIALGRTLWNVIDVIWAILLIGTLFIRQQRPPHKNVS
jgi:hypothetical protein